jgi:olefin beta-lactone synthetase
MTIGELLADQARTCPDAAALVDDRAGRTLTFSELADEVAHAAAWWQSQGIARGKAVLVFVPMSADLYVALLALFRLGAVALFLDPSAGRRHIEQCCALWTPDALLAIPKAHLLRLTSGALRRIPLKVSLDIWLPGSTKWPRKWGAESCATNVAEPADPALVTFTSGSTGQPKAALRTHRFLLAQHRALESSISLEAGEIDLATLPIFTLANLAAGVTTVIPDVDLRRPGAIDAETVFAHIQRRGVSRLTASPAFWERLVEYGQSTGRTLPTLRKIFTGGAPVFPRLLRSVQALAPEADVVAVYGSTEAEPIAHVGAAEMTPLDFDSMQRGRGLLAGTPVKEVTLRIVQDRWGIPRGQITADDLDAQTMPPGEVGEIVVSGEHVLKGYLGGIGDEETKFRVGSEVWHRTGDAGLLDQEGRLWLQGRCAARIDDNQGSLYPFGVECVAMAFPDVRRAAFLAQAGRRLLVVESVAEAGLQERLRVATAWAGVEEVRFIRRIPVDKRHNSKIDYPKLGQLIK